MAESLQVMSCMRFIVEGTCEAAVAWLLLLLLAVRCWC
jgi:hypothetical protein